MVIRNWYIVISMRTIATRTWVHYLGLATALAAVSAPADADRTLIHKAVIDAPASTIWQLFTTSDGARQWMAPLITIDLQPGGNIHSSYNPESTLDDEHTIINRILTYVPQRMLAIQNVQAPVGFAHPELFQQTWSVMYFTPVDDNRTNVRIVGLNYGEGPDWDTVYAHFEQGNAYLLNLLAKAAPKFDTNRSDDSDSLKPVHQPSTGSPPIETEVTIAAPLDAIWRAWATADGISSFFAPKAIVDLRIGGTYELHFAPEAPEGQRGTEGCRILAYEPKRMLSFSWNAPPQFPNARDYHTWVVLEFDQRDDEGVTVQLSQMGFQQLKTAHPEHADEIDRMRAYFDRVWPHVLDSLRKTLESQD